MEKQVKIYNKRNQIKKEIIELQIQLQIAKEKLINIQNKCPHDIVLKYNDNRIYKIGDLSYCLCPACEKKENIYAGNCIEETSFKNSKKIDLTNISDKKINRNLPIILNHINENYDYYYDNNISEKELSNSIIELISRDNKQKVLKQY